MKTGLVVELEHHRYRIVITANDNGPLCDFLDKISSDRRVLILTNSVVGPRLLPGLKRGLQRRGLKSSHLILPDGERHKNMKTIGLCYDWLLKQGADRQSVLVMLGGGVLGDIGGFVAATYMRGLRYVQVPTTLLSQVDSSIGGKVGVDHKEGKNLLGAFYQPHHVHIDVAYLKTLPEREYLCGFAEVIKYAIIRDPALFDLLKKKRASLLARDPALLMRVVRTCCRIKADVVTRDEKEISGLRMILNFGHTVGHAVERLTHYRRFGHGEAVAMGMVQAARISQHFGFCSEKVVREVEDLILDYGLPVTPPRFAPREWERSLLRDKKIRGDRLHFVFVQKIGKVKVSPVLPKEIAKLLKK